MWVKEKFCSLLILIFYFSFSNAYANLEKNLLEKYKTINTLSFNFIQKIDEKIETGNCYIKYPLLMRCDYPEKKKTIIVNKKKFAIIKKRYKKIYYFSLKQTPMYYLLKKENILDLIKNHEPKKIDSKLIEYELIDSKSNKLNIFFDRKTLSFKGWKTIDAYSNEVNFIIKNLENNIQIDDKVFKIPAEEDL